MRRPVKGKDKPRIPKKSHGGSIAEAVAAKRAAKSLPAAPQSYTLGDKLDWNAPWIEVTLRVELPFWLLVDNLSMNIDVGGHEYPVSIHCETYELQIDKITDSKVSTLYRGPYRKPTNLSPQIQALISKRPELMVGWRKFKTALIIHTRCNEDVWNRRIGTTPANPAAHVYLNELCRGHLPIVNKLIQHYRLMTYDRFVFEVSPWDVPVWTLQAADRCVSVGLVPYRAWDDVPILQKRDGSKGFIRLIKPADLNSAPATPSPGELELLDAINFMERGNYSDAIRRMATALELLVQTRVFDIFAQTRGAAAAAKFIKDTEMNQGKRIGKYEELNGRKLSRSYKNQFSRMRALRHHILHEGHRISPAERDVTQKLIDAGRWMFNWFENVPSRAKARESQAALRSLGREMYQGIFLAELRPEGVTVRSLLMPKCS
jgi:hypothetical protein